MRQALAIVKKDFKALVLSPMFLLLVCFCTAIWSYNYLRALSMFAEASSLQQQMHQAGANIHFRVFVDHISVINLIFIFILPAITMRLIAEEKKMRTFDLLLTSPITALDIALGKFFAGFVVALVLLAVSLIYPLGTRLFTDFSLGPLWASYFGIALIAGVYVAIGLFASSLSQSVVLSVVFGILFNLILWLVGQGTAFSNEPTIMAILEHISLPQQFFSFLKGSIPLDASVFLVSCIIFFIFLSERVIESSRWR